MLVNRKGQRKQIVMMRLVLMVGMNIAADWVALLVERSEALEMPVDVEHRTQTVRWMR